MVCAVVGAAVPSGDVAMVLSKPCPKAAAPLVRAFCMAPEVAALASEAGAADGGVAGNEGGEPAPKPKGYLL